ncbi:MAG: type II secretion system protein [Candidatus Doudnabacteria bacterium]|nr:type II secretion system protein [Candidatus Doudnabacteria bacterium]
MLYLNKQTSAFTLIELIVVLGILSILMTLVLVALDPATRFAQARNAKRWTEVNAILEALVHYDADHSGYPSVIDSSADTSQIIGTNSKGCDTGCGDILTKAECVDLDYALGQRYLAKIPCDPLETGCPGFSGYYVNILPERVLVVGACDPELGITIKVMR